MANKLRTSKKKRAAQRLAPAANRSAVSPSWVRRSWFWPGLILALVLVFYWIPLTDPNTSVQWDAVDVHYSSQKYFADRIVHGEIPFWTPYLFSGFPFLADPQVGAWYPLNWPFFLAGITPLSLQAELVLHALLACLGAFLLFGRFVPDRRAAFVGALLYAYSGFFAEHSSHIGMFCTAALLPWLLLFVDLAFEQAPLRYTALAGAAGGSMLLAGHFQTSLYAFTALALFGLARLIERPRLSLRIASILAITAIIAILLSSIQTLPGLQLTSQSIRSVANFGSDRGRALNTAGILNLVWPNATKVFDHPDGSGITDAQFYLYSGLFLVPLAVAGLRRRSVGLAALLLTILPFWYMFGPDGGLYRLVSLLPGFQSVRSPVHFWFAVVLGLALAACAGASWILERWNRPWVAAGLIAIVFLDLLYWNSLANPLAYARYSFADLYGNREQMAREKVVSAQPPGTRFSMPDRLTVFGPLNHPLDVALETTYGYNPLELLAYAAYREAAAANPALQNGLNISRSLDTKLGQVIPNPGVLPRAYFAKEMVRAANMAESRRLLQTLDPARSAIVLESLPAVQVDPQATVTISREGEQAYRIRYHSARRGLLKISVPHFPGWKATIDGQPCSLLRVDHNLMGAEVPPGDKELLLRFHSTWFVCGALVSGATLLICLGICLWVGFRRSPAGQPV